jgi:hypothetical protein
MFQVVLKFSPTPPPQGKSFNKLRVTLTDASNTPRVSDIGAGTLKAGAQLQADGSYQYVMPTASFQSVAAGPYSIQAVPMDSMDQPMAAPVSGTGNVSLDDGMWMPAVIAFA